MVAGGCAVLLGAGWIAAPDELPTLDLVDPVGDPAPSDGATAAATDQDGGAPAASPTPTLSCEADDSGDVADDDKDRAEDEDCVLVTPSPAPEPTAGGDGDSASGSSVGASATVDGPVVTNVRGDYQARITVVDGVVTEVEAVVAGTSAPESVSVNAFAIPELRQRVLDAQSWDVEAVSGASFTSPAFIESLQGAFAEAGL